MMKKISSVFLALLMVISGFAGTAVTAQAATAVSATVTSFADFENKISKGSIKPVLNKSDEKYARFSYQYEFTAPSNGYYFVLTNVASDGLQYATTGKIMNAMVETTIYSGDLTKTYAVATGRDAPVVNAYSRVYLTKGNYTAVVYRSSSSIYPAQTTKLYVAKLQSGISPITVTYAGASNGGKNVKLKINSVDKINRIVINNSNGEHQYSYSVLLNVGEDYSADSSSCVTLKLKDPTFSWAGIAVEDVYGAKSTFEYQILNSYTASISGLKTKTYTGKAIKQSGLTVKAGYKEASYTASYKNNKNVGKATVTFKGKGKTIGSVSKTFTIKPKSTSISKVTAGKKKFTVKWKKQTSQTTGYQIQYSTSSKFKSAKTVTVGKNKTTSKSISKLKAKKKYYVRVRTYKTVKINGKSTKIYSSWSKAKSVTTKK